jgi:hypothetical protein
MFNFRPHVPGFNVEPPADAEVPGFRMNADGSVRTDGPAMGRSPSYIPVGWTPPIADDYGNAEIALSNSAGQPAEAAQPMLPFHLGGRIGAGLLLGYAGLPWLPPFAMFGDALSRTREGR